MKDKVDICPTCKGTGKNIKSKFKGLHCQICEGTGVKLSDETTEITALIGGEMSEDDPRFLDFDEEDYEI